MPNTAELFDGEYEMLIPKQDPDCSCRRSSSRPARRPEDVRAVTGPLHRIAEVRRLQGVSLRAARQTLLLTSDEVRQQEHETHDLLLSQLYRWQQLLDVPVSELLVESHLELSQPILTRASLVKAMKTVATILDVARQPDVRRLAERLIDQLLEVMPELAGVSGWPAVGQRRTMDELGRIAQHPLTVVAPEDM
jgi:hypothetical protein